jgi:excisionase family DNA binding protein
VSALPSPALPPAFIGVREAAGILGMPTSRVYRLVGDGELPAGREGKALIIPTPAVYAWAAQRTCAMAHGGAAASAVEAADQLAGWAAAVADGLRAAGEVA